MTDVNANPDSAPWQSCSRAFVRWFADVAHRWPTARPACGWGIRRSRLRAVENVLARRCSRRSASRDVFAAPIRQPGNDLSRRWPTRERTRRANSRAVSRAARVLLTELVPRGQRPGVSCSNGTVRDLRMLTDRIDASVRQRKRLRHRYRHMECLLPGTSTSVGVLQVTASFTWNRQRLPPTDFHVFDGSILPGYVDGVVTIPADTEPFCSRVRLVLASVKTNQPGLCPFERHNNGLSACGRR